MAATQKRLLEAMKGQKFRIDGLCAIFPPSSWPAGLQPDYEAMKVVVDNYLEEILPNDEAKLRRYKRNDLASFGAMWRPYAGYEELETVTFFMLWLFMWDDELDLDSGKFYKDYDGAQAYRRESLRFIRQTLAVDEELDANHESTANAHYGRLRPLDEYPPPSPYPTTENFRHVAERFRKGYSDDRRKMLYDELEFYIRDTVVEQQVHLSGRIPSIADFWAFRLGSGACGVLFATIEYAYGIRLPVHLLKHDAMRTLWDLSSVIILTVNDMLSIKKEVDGDAILSLVPLLLANEPQLGNSVQAAVDSSLEQLRAACAAFDATANALLRLAGRIGPTHTAAPNGTAATGDEENDSRDEGQAYGKRVLDALTGKHGGDVSIAHALKAAGPAPEEPTGGQQGRDNCGGSDSAGDAGRAGVVRDMGLIIKGLRYMITGNVYWSLYTGRYGVEHDASPTPRPVEDKSLSNRMPRPDTITIEI